jgi:uncharacterized repeat protein (TIGR01451 family)
LTSATSYTWNSFGPQTIVISATNSGEIVTATQVVTVFAGDCQPITDVTLSRLPVDKLSTDTKVRFMVDAVEGDPFNFTWTLDGVPQDETKGAWEYQFPAAMTYTVGVTVTNDCTPVPHYLSETVVVEDLTGKPDMTQSFKWVSSTDIQVGDRLTYTLFIRNLSPIMAENYLVRDAIPANTSYIADTAQANGVPITVTGDVIEWRGDVVLGTPVVIEYAVEVTAVDKDNPVVNHATLGEDPADAVTITTVSSYNPDYKLIVNDGAKFTNIPTVTLKYQWTDPAADKKIVSARLSNDSGFGAGNTVIRSIMAGTPNPNTENGWQLLSEGSYLLPRIGFARFQDGYGQYYGPASDDIIYDPVPPKVDSVMINGFSAKGFASRQTQDVMLRITVSDDNSGVSYFKISNTANFLNEYIVRSATSTVELPWTLYAPGVFYLRVYDRAGNESFVESGLIPPEDITITGPTTPTIAGMHIITLTANINPITTSRPITYIWQATDMDDTIIHSGVILLTDTVVLTWPLSQSGVKTITVTALNLAGVISNTYTGGVSNTYTIELLVPVEDKKIYLPILLRQ